MPDTSKLEKLNRELEKKRKEERLTNDDVMLLLKLIFHRQDTQELLKKLLEREKAEPLSLLRVQLYTT